MNNGHQLQQVVIGFLGTVLDVGKGADRWAHWRPTVSLCQQEDFLVNRLELLYAPGCERLLNQVVEDIQLVSPETVVNCHELPIQDPWDFEEVYATLHDFAWCYDFRTEDETYLVHITTGTHVAQICLFLLTESRYFPGRLIQGAPPRPRRGGGPGPCQIIDLDLSRYDRLAQRFAAEIQESTSLLKSGIPTRNARFNQLIEQLEQVAVRSESPILLTGPTGSGKSHLARQIFELKRKRQDCRGKLVEVNCATLRGDAAMSALFGHIKGAFTGAVQARDGLLKAADQGVLFLDEIGELGSDEQAMLLRAIEQKWFLPVGADTEVESHFQLLAGTNRDLTSAVQDGRFREDLLCRINLWTFPLPALRERPEDIEPNLLYELELFARQTGMKVTFQRDAWERFLRFATDPESAWAGNFRDLNAAVTRLATLSHNGRITPELVEGEITRLREFWRPPEYATPDVLRGLLTDEQWKNIDLFDRVQLAEVVRICRNAKSLSAAGRVLFAESRKERKRVNDADRLRKYLSRFGLNWESLRSFG